MTVSVSCLLTTPRFMPLAQSQTFKDPLEVSTFGPHDSSAFHAPWPHQANKPRLDWLPARPWWPLAIKLRSEDSTEDLVIHDSTNGNRQSRSSMPKKSHLRAVSFTPSYTPRFRNRVCKLLFNYLRPGLKFQPSNFLTFPWPHSLIYKMGIFSQHPTGS